MLDNLRFVLVVLAVAGAIAAIPTYLAVRGMLAICGLNRVRVWSIALVLAMIWCGAAVWEASRIVEANRRATEFQPAAGADWGAIFQQFFIRIPLWLVALFPSFPATLALFAKPPRTISEPSRTQRRRGRDALASVFAGPHRWIAIGATIVLLAISLRVAIWALLE